MKITVFVYGTWNKDDCSLVHSSKADYYSEMINK